ncbi:MAG: hypothetical protein KJ064_14585 [Anaerolineae bacterium]|nr:hypothetical protein [Anaerolineae bacterium]
MVKQAQKQKPAHVKYLPAMGLVLAVTYGAMAYFIGPMVVKLLSDNSQDFADKIKGNEQYFEYGMSAIVWFLLLMLTFILVSAVIGEDPEEEFRVLKPRAGDRKQTKKYIRYQEKLAKTRTKQIEEYKAKLAQQEAELKKKK